MRYQRAEERAFEHLIIQPEAGARRRSPSYVVAGKWPVGESLSMI